MKIKKIALPGRAANSQNSKINSNINIYNSRVIEIVYSARPWRTKLSNKSGIC